MGAFRIERMLAASSSEAVYEATQVSLRRAVALRLIAADRFTSPEQLARFDHRQRLAASVHHPNLVPCYEAGEWEGGRFIATRLIRGSTLVELWDRGSPPAGKALEPLENALRAAHAIGLAHGRISSENILIEPDGTPFLADLGLADRGSPQEDLQALARVVSRLPDENAPGGPSVSSRRWLGLGLVALAAAAAVVIFTPISGGGDESQDSLRAPASPMDTSVVGSTLPAVAVQPLGCAEDPSANTPACTFEPARIDGRAVTVERAGVIRSWAVRGASGDLALQIIRERAGKSFVVGFSQPERLTGPAPQAFPADISVRPGDRIGVRLAPGSAIGALADEPGAEVVRWDGGLTADSQAVDGTTLPGEIMLRADVEFGGRPVGPDQLLGAEAASAPEGEVLATTPVALGRALRRHQAQDRRLARATLVELPDGIAVDLLSGRRLARISVPDADPAGALSSFVQSCGGAGARGFCLFWRNPGAESTLTHAYRVRSSGRINLIG